jgi:PAS domain S-box-containing protein
MGRTPVFESEILLHQLRFIADSVPVHLNYLDRDFRFVFVNESSAEFWGFSPKDMIGKRIADLIGDQAFKQIGELFMKVLGGEVVTHEAPFIGADGMLSFFVNSYIPDFDSQGNVIGLAATGTDVTERKRSLDESRRLADEFKSLADSMPQIVWTALPNGDVDFFSRRWFDVTGLTPGQFTARDWEQVVHPDDYPQLDREWRECMRDRKFYEIEFRLKHAATGEYRWYLVRARPVLDDKGNIQRWYGSSTDIHDQKMTQRNLEIEQQLRERLVSTLSHDLRTPITAAKLSSQLMLRHKLEPAVRKLAFRVEENMVRADRMIRDLLDSSKARAGYQLPIKPSECDLSEIVQSVVDEFTVMHGHRFVLHVPSHVKGYWDFEGVRRILENLLSNALKYGGENTEVVIFINPHPDSVTLSVLNFGNPIPEKELPFLFEPFTRSELAERRIGWGIGLGLVKGLAEAHGGTVTVESSEEKGTLFSVHFPIRVIENEERAESHPLS